MNGSLLSKTALVDRALQALLACLVVVFALVQSRLVFAQEEPSISVDQLIVSEAGDGLTVVLSVLDPAGRPVSGLATFEAFVDGTPAPADSVEPVVNEDTGIAVLLTIDVSGSMKGEPLAQAQAAAGSFVEGLLAHDIAALATFAGIAPNEATYTSDRPALLAAIAALETEEETGTALYDAVANSLTIAANAPTARRAVVLLTDGQDSGAVSTRTRDDALDAAATAGLPIYAVGLGAEADANFLQTLAQETGGAFYLAPAPSDVPGIFDAIGAALRGQYVLTLALPPAEDADRELVVTLELEGALLTTRATFVDPAAMVEAADGGGGLPVWFWPASVLALVLLSAPVASALVRRRLKPASALAGGPGHNVSPPLRSRGPAHVASNPGGKLTVVEGPNAGVSVSLASGPIDIGSDPSCGLGLDAGDGAVAGTHARVWLRGSRLMLHHLARGRQTLVGDQPMEWAILEPNDTLQIGPYVITFALDG